MRGEIRAVYTYLSERLGLGLKQLLAGARKFKLDLIDRKDIASMSKLASEVTGIPTIVSQLTPRSLIIFKPFLQKCLIAALSNLFGAIRETMATRIVQSKNTFVCTYFW